MKKILVLYYSKTGNTKMMAEYIAKGTKSEKIETDVKKVEDIDVDDLVKYDGIIIGTPVYFGHPVYQIKEIIDKSIKYFGKMKGKVGGAFSTSGGIGGGNETAIRSIVDALMIHGMILQGFVEGGHYGPVSIGTPDKRVEDECLKYGMQIAKLVLKL